jgi:hypothetical protein
MLKAFKPQSEDRLVSAALDAAVLDPEGAHLAALRRLADFQGQRVLEMGCGEGVERLQPRSARVPRASS